MRVGLFVTCLVDLMRPSIGFASLRLLESAGCEVVVPTSQTCCGQPGFNSGDRKTAIALAQKWLAEFQGCDYIVVPSGSCAGMIRGHYPQLFTTDHELRTKINELAPRTYELTDFLANVLKVERLPGRFHGRVTYHDSCAGLRELGIQQQPRALLAQMPGVNVIEMHEATTCCGFGGTFAVKYGDIATRLADDKCRHIADSGAEAIVAGDLGCLLHIEGRLRRRGDHKTQVLHIAEVLAGTGTACN